ncbi:MAG: hypothetical protein IPH60_15185 [Flavobacteriales bacterium]|nr:hypothetical protein [Flavobacteriales bacterium]
MYNWPCTWLPLRAAPRLPSDGANQTWDLSTITVQPVGTLDFIAASATPFAANYPTANWVWAQSLTGEGTDYVYLSITSSGIEVVANDVPSATNNYTDPKHILQFPMSLGQSLTDSYTDMDGPSSVTWSYTGHGTAITPLGTFADLAKVVSTEDDLLLWNTTPLYPLVIDNGSTVLVFAPSNVGIEASGHGPQCRCTPILARTAWWWRCVQYRMAHHRPARPHGAQRMVQRHGASTPRCRGAHHWQLLPAARCRRYRPGDPFQQTMIHTTSAIDLNTPNAMPRTSTFAKRPLHALGSDFTVGAEGFPMVWEGKFSVDPRWNAVSPDLAYVVAGDMEEIEMLDGITGKALWKYNFKEKHGVKQCEDWIAHHDTETIEVITQKDKNAPREVNYLDYRTGQVVAESQLAARNRDRGTLKRSGFVPKRINKTEVFDAAKCDHHQAELRRQEDQKCHGRHEPEYHSTGQWGQ